jgi:HEAT repeat protein
MSIARILTTLLYFTLALIAGAVVGAGVAAGLSPLFSNPDRGLANDIAGGVIFGLFAGGMVLTFVWSRLCTDRLALVINLAAAARGLPIAADPSHPNWKLSPATLVVFIGISFTAFFQSLSFHSGPAVERLTVTEAGFVSFLVTLIGILLAIIVVALIDYYGKSWNSRPGVVWGLVGLMLAVNVAGYWGVQIARQRYIDARIVQLSDPNVEVRRSAAEQLQMFSPAARTAIPALCALRKDPDVNEKASEALYSIGIRLHHQGNDTLAASALVGALFPPSQPGQIQPSSKWDVKPALKRLGPAGARALAELLASTDAEEREVAAEAFLEFGPEASPAVPALQKGLKDTVDQVRFNSARALAQIAPDSPEMLPILREMLAGTEGHKIAGIEALSHLKPQADLAAPLLESQLDKEIPSRARWSAACGLVRLNRTTDDRIVPTLIEAAQTIPTFDARPITSACEALGELGPKASAAIPTLQQLAASPPPLKEILPHRASNYGLSVIQQSAERALARIKQGP